MADEIDLSDEVDPTERMVEQNEQARKRAERVENDREAEHNGEVVTESFNIEEALKQV